MGLQGESDSDVNGTVSRGAHTTMNQAWEMSNLGIPDGFLTRARGDEVSCYVCTWFGCSGMVADTDAAMAGFWPSQLQTYHHSKVGGCCDRYPGSRYHST
jgi:hypothetical protein